MEPCAAGLPRTARCRVLSRARILEYEHSVRPCLARAQDTPATTDHPEMSSSITWLESLSPWPEEFGVGRMRELLRRLGNPERRFEAIHVVGSNGKTTTVRSAEALLRRGRARRFLHVPTCRLVG